MFFFRDVIFVSLLSENVRRVLSHNVRCVDEGPRALDASAATVSADRRRKTKASSVRLAILADASRVRCAALRGSVSRKAKPPERGKEPEVFSGISSCQRGRRCDGGGQLGLVV
jgi:hypothetical protein